MFLYPFFIALMSLNWTSKGTPKQENGEKNSVAKFRSCSEEEIGCKTQTSSFMKKHLISLQFFVVRISFTTSERGERWFESVCCIKHFLPSVWRQKTWAIEVNFISNTSNSSQILNAWRVSGSSSTTESLVRVSNMMVEKKRKKIK